MIHSLTQSAVIITTTGPSWRAGCERQAWITCRCCKLRNIHTHTITALFPSQGDAGDSGDVGPTGPSGSDVCSDSVRVPVTLF